MRRRRAARSIVLVVAAGIGLGACNGGSGDAQAPPASPSTAAMPASPTIDPAAQPAVNAYLTYRKFVIDAQRAPGAWAASSRMWYRSYSFDPVRSQTDAYLHNLVGEKEVDFRGTPPQAHVSVVSVDLGAEPYPMVVLSDCPAPYDDWKAYEITWELVQEETYTAVPGTVVPSLSSPYPPPYRLTVEVIYKNGYPEIDDGQGRRWGVATITADKSQTCTA